MKYISLSSTAILIAVVIFVSAQFAHSQNSAADLVRLRVRVGITKDITITFSKDKDISGKRDLSVYLATDDKGLSKKYLKWVEKWNEDNGSQHGMISTVSALSEADIVLVSFDDKSEVNVVPRTTVGIADPRRSIPSPEKEPRVRTDLFIPTPTYTYLLFQSPGKVEILFSNVDKSHPSNDINTGKQLIKKIEEKLKF